MSRTAFTSGQKTYMLAHPQAIIGLGLAVHVPAIIWQGVISSVPAYPTDGTGIGQMTVTTTAGAFGNVREGMTVVIGSTDTTLPDSRRYTTYARKLPTSTILYIDAFGQGTATTSSNFTVYDEYLPFPRRQRWDSGSSSFLANYDEAYTDQNENFGPQAVFGCSAVWYKNGSVTFAYDATRSIAHTPGSTITAYAWTFPDGTTTTGSTASWVTSTARPNGGYTHLTVTDSNADTHTGHRLAFKFDSSNKPYVAGIGKDFEILSYEGEWGGGWTADIRFNDPFWGLTDATFPSRHCVLFGTTAYGSDVTNIGGNFPDRENIWLDGWMVNDDWETSVTGQKHTQRIATVNEMMRIHGFAIALDDNATPTTWLKMKNLTLDRAMWHFCRWKSTVGDMVDVTFLGSAAAIRVNKYMDAPAGTIWNQMQSMYARLMGGQVSSDCQSGIYCEQDVTTNTVLAAPTMLYLVSLETSNYWTYLRENFSQNTRPTYILPTAKITNYGVNYDVSVGSRAPDDPIAHGEQIGGINAGLFCTQTEMNLWSGRQRTAADALRYAQTFPLNGIIRIDPTPQCFVKLDESEQSAVVRGVSWTFDLEHGMAYPILECQWQGSLWPNGITVVFTA